MLWGDFCIFNSVFSGHKRNSIFMNAQKDVNHKTQLERVACTRWNSRQAAVDTTIQCYSSILDALDLLVSSADSATCLGCSRSIYATEGHPVSENCLRLERDICSGWTSYTPASRGLHGSCYGCAAHR